jgi:branched-chain amino acid transport system substrate-binding protein
VRDQKHRGLRRSVVGVVVAGLVGVGALAGTAGGATEAAPGVTDDSVKLGYIYSGSGLASATHRHAGQACQARVDAQNAKGGVNGRTIELTAVDDQSGPGQNLTAAQDLIRNEDVFAVINNSALAFASWRFIKENGVPLIGGGFDGTYYGEEGNEGIISALGNAAPVVGLTYDTTAKMAKKLGATKMASVAYQISPSSTASAEATQKYGAPAHDLEPVYLNTSLEFGTKDVQPIVLGIKNSGADALYLPLDSDTNFAVVQALQQNGVKMKANILATGYSQDLLDQPIKDLMTPNDVMFSQYKPIELKNDPAVKAFVKDIRKGGLEGVPDYGTYLGYITCDLAITGLEEAGQNPTRQSFIDGIRGLGEYDGAGLPCAPLQVGLDSFGHAPPTSCSYFIIVEDGKFKVLNNGKPLVGKLVGDPKLIAANKAKAPITTTTTAAPA